MQNPVSRPGGAIILYGVAALTLLVALQRHMVLAFPLEDPFHLGEFVAAAMAVLHQPPFEGDPYTIHGIVDIIPALLTSSFAPPDKFIAYTVLTYPIMSILAAGLVFLAGLRIAKQFGVHPVLLLPCFAFLPFGVGWRDLFFALSLYLFTRLLLDRDRGGREALAQVIFGLVVAIGMYWSFNRGAVAIAAFGPIVLWLAWYDRRYLISVATVLLAFPALGWVMPGMSLVGYFENFLMLLETSSQWGYGPSVGRKILTAAVFACFAAAVVAVFVFTRTNRPDRNSIALLISLLIAATIYVKIGLGRIDFSHVLMSSWLPLLIVCVCVKWSRLDIPQTTLGRAALIGAALLGVIVGLFIFEVTNRNVYALVLLMTFLIALPAVLPNLLRQAVDAGVALILVAMVSASALAAWDNVQTGKSDWLVTPHNLPSDDKAVTEMVRWSAQEIAKSGAQCVFDLANMGMVNAAARLPSCSRFTYPVYANAAFEDTLIADLKAAAPPAILYSSDFWAYAIDDKPMSDRFPALDAEIRKAYPREVCNVGVCLRYTE